MKREQRKPLEKAVRIIRALVDVPDTQSGVRDLARACKLSASTVHRTLEMMEDEGLVAQHQEGGPYYLGLEFFRIALRVVSSFPVGRVALPILRQLMADSGETSLLYLYDPVRMELLPFTGVETRKAVRSVAEWGTWGPVYAGASGLGVMAFLPEAERKEIVARTRLDPVTERTVTDPDQLEAVLAQVRRQGYAFSRGQRIQGAVGISAPIWGPDGRVMGDIVVTLPEQRFEPEMEQEFSRLVIHYAGKMTEALGGAVPRTNGSNGELAGSGGAPADQTPSRARGLRRDLPAARR